MDSGRFRAAGLGCRSALTGLRLQQESDHGLAVAPVLADQKNAGHAAAIVRFVANESECPPARARSVGRESDSRRCLLTEPSAGAFGWWCSCAHRCWCAAVWGLRGQGMGELFA
jgi:hypothetical protein